jgi:hypothetical protein
MTDQSDRDDSSGHPNMDPALHQAKGGSQTTNQQPFLETASTVEEPTTAGVRDASQQAESNPEVRELAQQSSDKAFPDSGDTG